jgi:hypothetical protein
MPSPVGPPGRPVVLSRKYGSSVLMVKALSRVQVYCSKQSRRRHSNQQWL